MFLTDIQRFKQLFFLVTLSFLAKASFGAEALVRGDVSILYLDSTPQAQEKPSTIGLQSLPVTFHLRNNKDQGFQFTLRLDSLITQSESVQPKEEIDLRLGDQSQPNQKVPFLEEYFLFLKQGASFEARLGVLRSLEATENEGSSWVPFGIGYQPPRHVLALQVYAQSERAFIAIGGFQQKSKVESEKKEEPTLRGPQAESPYWGGALELGGNLHTPFGTLKGDLFFLSMASESFDFEKNRSLSQVWFLKPTGTLNWSFLSYPVQNTITMSFHQEDFKGPNAPSTHKSWTAELRKNITLSKSVHLFSGVGLGKESLPPSLRERPLTSSLTQEGQFFQIGTRFGTPDDIQLSVLTDYERRTTQNRDGDTIPAFRTPTGSKKSLIRLGALLHYSFEGTL